MPQEGPILYPGSEMERENEAETGQAQLSSKASNKIHLYALAHEHRGCSSPRDNLIRLITLTRSSVPPEGPPQSLPNLQISPLWFSSSKKYNVVILATIILGYPLENNVSFALFKK